MYDLGYQNNNCIGLNKPPKKYLVFVARLADFSRMGRGVSFGSNWAGVIYSLPKIATVSTVCAISLGVIPFTRISTGLILITLFGS